MSDFKPFAKPAATTPLSSLDSKETYGFRMKDSDNYRWYSLGAPSEWAKERGATHSLQTIDGWRPAIVLKTVIYVGIDEAEHENNGDIEWEKWDIRHVDTTYAAMLKHQAERQGAK